MTKSEPSVSRARQELPDGWLRPRPSMQATLFPRPTDEALATLGVSRGDVRRWRDLGWVSFDVDAMEKLDQPEEWEIGFVRNVARSTLSVKQIDELLAGLPRPLRYDPVNTVFHFEYGWVVRLAEDPLEVVDREIEGWIEHLRQDGDTDRLQALADVIADAIDADDSEES